MAKLEEGAQAPAFTLPDQDGNPVSLDDFKGAKVLVYFYPADDTPGCTKEACQFNDNLAAFQAAGVPVIGISRDDAQSHQRLDSHVIATGKAGRHQLHQRVEALDGIALQRERSFVCRQGAVQAASMHSGPALQGVGVRHRGALGQPASLDQLRCPALVCRGGVALALVVLDESKQRQRADPGRDDWRVLTETDGLLRRCPCLGRPAGQVEAVAKRPAGAQAPGTGQIGLQLQQAPRGRQLGGDTLESADGP